MWLADKFKTSFPSFCAIWWNQVWDVAPQIPGHLDNRRHEYGCCYLLVRTVLVRGKVGMKMIWSCFAVYR